MTKIEDGNIKAIIRIITSGEGPAAVNSQSYNVLCRCHPSAASDRAFSPDPTGFLPAQSTEEDVSNAIRSLPAGFAGCPDGFRPQNLRDLTFCNEKGPDLLNRLTAFINLLMQSKCRPLVARILSGGRLIAIQKKSGGRLRSIAIGYTFRRLAANVSTSTLSPCLETI
jgi:hypothetical protein